MKIVANQGIGFSVTKASGVRRDIKRTLMAYTERLTEKAVFCRPLPGNSGEADSELDLQVRRAFKKSPLVLYEDNWYHTKAGGHELLESKAGVQMRNVGVDFLFFGNAWDFAGFGYPNSHPCGWIIRLEEAADSEELKEIARSVRKHVGASWAIMTRLVSTPDYWTRRGIERQT